MNGLFALVMLISINGQDHRFVLDRKLTSGDCYNQLLNLSYNAQKARGLRIAQTFACERGSR
jgi:hypothetical protein